MGLFGKKQPAEMDNDQSEDGELLDQLDALQETTQQVEAEKEAKRLAREERKFLKDLEKKRKQKEKLVAPFLLIVTILISWLLWTLSQRS